MRSLFSCQEDILNEYFVLSNIYQYALHKGGCVTVYFVELEPQILKEAQCDTTEPDGTLIILHNATKLIVIQHSTEDFLKEELQRALTQLEYLCSCLHPRERHSFVCHCTPEKCWCTCYCGKRMHCLNRVLKHKHMCISMWCNRLTKQPKPLTVSGNSCNSWPMLCNCDSIYKVLTDFLSFQEETWKLSILNTCIFHKSYQDELPKKLQYWIQTTWGCCYRSVCNHTSNPHTILCLPCQL